MRGQLVGPQVCALPRSLEILLARGIDGAAFLLRCGNIRVCSAPLGLLKGARRRSSTPREEIERLRSCIRRLCLCSRRMIDTG